MTDILTEEDVRRMVDSFYDKVNKDALLSPVFNEVAKVEWEAHLPKMYKFWNALILGLKGYEGQPFPPHSMLPIKAEHFGRWVELFVKNIDEQFSGEIADGTKERARHIANVFQYKLGLIR